MRKRYHAKRRSCTLCKPNKRGYSHRHTDRELQELVDFEKRREEYLGKRVIETEDKELN